MKLAMKRMGLVAIGVCIGLGVAAVLPDRLILYTPLGTFRVYGDSPFPAPTGRVADLRDQRIRVPAGFSLNLFADGISGPRLMRFSEAGDLLVSQPGLDRILLLERDRNRDGRADGRRVLLDELDDPHGLDLHEGWLDIAEKSRIGRVRFDPESGSVMGSVDWIVEGLPSQASHRLKSLRVGPDGWLYVNVGSGCNACEEADPRRATILRFRTDGSGEEVFATGLRNSVGFDWRPTTGEMFATENGRDLLGDDSPPCEFNRIRRGGFYGYPYAHGQNVPDPELGADHPDEIAAAIPPAHGFRAHNAPLGFTFVGSDTVPAAYRGAALVALHGSWNRTRRDGYKVVSLHWPAPGTDGVIQERDFLWGLEEDDVVIGRPVDVAEGPDRAFYVSDDFAGVIYRLAYGSLPDG